MTALAFVCVRSFTERAGHVQSDAKTVMLDGQPHQMPHFR